MQTRPYQTKAVAEIVRSLPLNPILNSPTGTGKTKMAVDIVRSMHGRTLWVAHRRELIAQAYRHLLQYFKRSELGIIMAGEPVNRNARIHIASIQTLINRDVPDIDVIVIDECHHAGAGSYQLLKQLRRPFIGLTATPFRLDGKPLNTIFGKIITAITPREAVEQEYLVPTEVYACDRPNLAEIKTTAGDFNNIQLGQEMSKPRIIGNIIEEFQKRICDRKTLVFASNIKHSLTITAAFVEAGIRAAHLDANTPNEDRAKILDDLRNDRIQVVSNVGILTEGFDLPDLDALIIARPTLSRCLHQQMIGRVVRAANGKDKAIIHDHAGNHHRHGLFTHPLEYSLESKIKTAVTCEPLGLRTCQNCLVMFPSHLCKCPICGAAVITNTRKLMQEIPGDLVEFDDETFEYKNAVWNTIKDDPDCEKIYARRFKDEPVLLRGKLLDPKNTNKKDKRDYYNSMIEADVKPVVATLRYKKAFGKKPYWLTKGFIGYQQRKMRGK